MTLARIEGAIGSRDEAMARGERAFEVLSSGEPGEEVALLAARLAVDHWFRGGLELAAERADLALDLAEAQGFHEPLAVALRAESGLAGSRGHYEVAEALLKHALEIAVEHDLAQEAAVLLLQPL